MDYKWIGAVLIIAGCGGFGFSLAFDHRKEERNLQSILRILDFMASELHFRGTPLPELCRSASTLCKNSPGQVFSRLAQELESRQNPEVSTCMSAALESTNISGQALEILRLLGNSMGRFDLEGQLKGLEECRNNCRRQLEELAKNRDSRLRNYQTLSLCAGAALAILLI